MHRLKVLEGGLSHQAISDAAVSSLKSTTTAAALADGRDWQTLHLERLLNFLIEQAPEFKQLLRDLLRDAGAHGLTIKRVVITAAAQFPLPHSCGENRH